MTILVVEDEVKITRFIKKGLEMEHYTVETAYDGEEALEKAEINNYDLIIMDIMIPKVPENYGKTRSKPRSLC